METKKIVGFSEREVAEGIRYSFSKNEFKVDKRFLLRSANIALERIKKDPRQKLLVVCWEILREVRDYQAKRAYVTAIAKMFSERSAVARHSKAF